MNRDTYTVHAKRWERGWELHISGPDGYQGVSQAHGLTSAERMARSYISLDLEVPEDSFEVTIVPEVGGFLGDLIKDAKAAVYHLAEVATSTAEKQRRAVAELHGDGMTQTEIADVMKISQQRVSQLLGAPQDSRKTRTKRPASSGRKKVGHG